MMKIRKAAKKDLKEISKIFREESSKKPYFQRWTQKTALEKITEFFKRGDIYLVTIDKIVGFIALHTGVGESGKEAFVDELWLASGYQGKGIGKALVRLVEDIFKGRGISSIFLISHKKSSTYGFYKKLNYKPYNGFVLMGKGLK